MIDAVRVIRPNWELITQLRGRALSGPRPQEIRKIAVVDDDATIVRATVRSLKIICPTEEIKAQQFVSEPGLLNRLEFDAAFLDHDMPYLSGSEIMKIARASGFTGFLFGMTGEMEVNSPKFYSAGVDLVLPKPLIDYKLTDLFTFIS